MRAVSRICCRQNWKIDVHFFVDVKDGEKKLMILLLGKWTLRIVVSCRTLGKTSTDTQLAEERKGCRTKPGAISAGRCS